MPRPDQPTHDLPSVTPERTAEMAGVVERVTRWAEERADVVGLLLVGSYARGATRPDSDVDLVLLTTDEDRYADNAWTGDVGIGELTRVQPWGAVTERRFVTASGLEVEINIGSPDWARLDPVDPGTREVVSDGARPLYDPTATLAALIDACRT
ncbi:nucleotidyltransferase domain-containing protein [Micromonospora sp. NPDC049679]|uniref:nucleotidyltransferase domain-containing protein n=1 Tax=Micromonospora sp. NPDC049679 TaxID=3155920 RepID=UPI0033F0B60E